MMATVPHVTSGLGLRKFQADGFLLTRVYSFLLEAESTLGLSAAGKDYVNEKFQSNPRPSDLQRSASANCATGRPLTPHYNHQSSHLPLPLLFLPVSGGLMAVRQLQVFATAVGKSKYL